MQGWPPDLKTAVRDWLSYKNEKRQGYKETGLRTLLSQIWKAAETHGEAAVVEVIRNSMASGYMGITLDKLTSVPPRNPKTMTSGTQQPLSTKDWDELLDKI